MSIEVENYDPGDLSTLGRCGTAEMVNMEGERKVYKNGLGDITDEFFSFDMRYTKTAGCHQIIAANGPTSKPGGYVINFPLSRPEITDRGDDPTNGGRLTMEVQRISYDLMLKQFCGPCFNPGDLSIGTLSRSENSVNPLQASDAENYFRQLARFTNGQPEVSKDMSARPGIPELKRHLREWFDMFDILGTGVTDVPADPCSSGNRANCQLTP